MSATRAGTVVLAAALVVSLSLVATMPASQDVTAQEGSYVVEQGAQCEPITPLSGEETAAAFYDYRDHDTHESGYGYSSHGTTHLQQNDVSSVFLYEGPDGTSLVTVHDRLDGGTAGGAAEFEVIGLPADAEWTVEDDDYSDNADDAWNHGDVWSEIAWLWGADRTDGGVVTGLGDDFEVTIDPAFDERQSTVQSGGTTALHVLSDGVSGLDRIALSSLDDPVVIRSGTCGDPTVQYDRADGTILADVEDTGGENVALRPPAGGDDGVRYDRLSVAVSGPGTPTAPGTATIGMGVEGSPPALPGNDDATSLSALSVDAREGGVEEATLAFAVDAATLEEHNATADDVTVYEESGGDWQRAATDPVERRDGGIRFEANAGGDGRLAVVLEEPPITAAELSLDRQRIDAGETVEVTATVENTGDVVETETVSMVVFGEVVATREVTLGPDETETLSFDQRVDSSGSHTVAVAGEARRLDVEGDEPAASGDEDPDESSSGYLAVAVGALVALGLAVWWRRSPQE